MHTVKMLVSIGAGGALGAMARYLTTHWVMRITGGGFPFGTLAVNVLGSFLMGVLVEVLALRYNLSPAAQAFVVTGVLGGFTTFSTFSLEAGLLMERHAYGQAALYVGGSVFFAVLGLFAGLAFSRAMMS